MWKFMAWLVVSLILAVLGLIPEIVMYFMWGAVHPATELGRIAMAALFFLGGGGFCILFGVVAFAAWAAITGEFLKL